MADAVALTSTLIELLSQSGKLTSIGYNYSDATGDCPGELRELINELSSLSGVLLNVQQLVDVAESEGSALAAIAFLNGPMEDCAKQLDEMIKYLIGVRRTGPGKQKSGKPLLWPLKEKETRSWIEKIDRYKNMFSLALSVDKVTLTRKIYTELVGMRKELNKVREEGEISRKAKKRREFLEWLSPVAPETNHIAARKLQQPGTGLWFTEGKDFEHWLEEDHSFIWLHGVPGVGKTILSSIVIDKVPEALANQDFSLVYFYCDFKDAAKQDIINFWGSLVAQLVEQRKDDAAMVQKLLDWENNKQPVLDDLREAFFTLVSENTQTVIVIDALDEFEDRDDLIENLLQINDYDGANIKVLVTSRSDPDFKLAFENLPSVEIEEKDVAVDIELYVTTEIERRPRLKRLKPALKEEIFKTLVGEEKGMFRWTKRCLDHLVKLRSDKAIKSALQSLPLDWNETNDRTL